MGDRANYTLGSIVTVPDGRHAEVIGQLYPTVVLVQVKRLALMPVAFELDPDELRGCGCASPNPWADCDRPT